MKRLVNAYGLHQATHFLEGRRVSPDALARWAILELRWPLLAEFLAAEPHRVNELAIGMELRGKGVPPDLRPLFSDRSVRAVLLDAERSLVLDEESVRQIVG